MEYLSFKEIQHLLTGYARVVKYYTDLDEEKQTVSSGGNYQLNKMIEGRMEKGCFTGYVRELSANGGCQVGFWKTISIQTKVGLEVIAKQISVPWGKWASYLPDGSFRVKQDYYIGKQVKG